MSQAVEGRRATHDQQFDVVIIGGGHNGLVAASYLAAAGRSVAIFERRDIVGGAAVTEEFFPGFRNSTASYTVSLLHPQVISDLHLAEHGLRIQLRPMQNFLPLPNGASLSVPPDSAAFAAEVARHSPGDAARLGQWRSYLEAAVTLLRDAALETPPTDLARWPDLWSAFGWGRRLRALPADTQRNLFELFTRSAGEVLDHWFESDAVKALYGFDAVVGNYGSPYSAGSGYVLLHHAFGEVNGQRGVWGHAMGGMGAITQAMAREALARGVQINTGTAVSNVLIEGGRAQGVRLADGRVVRARVVAGNVNPRILYLQMIESAALPADFVARMERFRCGSATFRMNVALSELPRFDVKPEIGEHHKSGIIFAPSLGYMDRAFAEARLNGWSGAPIVEMLIPSTVDDSLAPPGAHVASLFCQHFAAQLPDGRHWEDERTKAANLVLDTVNQYAPNFRRSVLGYSALSPWDLEQRFGLVGGDIFHGALSLDQLWASRPVLGYGDYRSPIAGLYLCGSGAHPGGGVTGLPGRNAARRILSDWRRMATKTRA